MDRETSRATTADVLAVAVGHGSRLTDRDFAALFSVSFYGLRDRLTRLEAAGVICVERKTEPGVPAAEQAWRWASLAATYRIQPGIEPGPRAASYDQLLSRAKDRGFDLAEQLEQEIRCHSCKAEATMREWTGARRVWSERVFPDHMQTLQRLGREVIAVEHTCSDCTAARNAEGARVSP